MRNLFDIKDQVMVITGGTGVLGTSMTEYLAEQGAKMVVLGRNIEKGEAIVNGIKKKGVKPFFYSQMLTIKRFWIKTQPILYQNTEG